jgi:predicted  nucleic acid-binding Zn-ribbon protein
MPHICTRCNNVFSTGEDILKGCPVCGWKKFMFMRRAPQIEGPGEPLISKAMGVRVPPRGPQPDRPEAQNLPLIQSPEAVEAAEKPEGQKETLESIKITAPGTYELNLPTLFEREELIMAVKEGTYFIDLSSAFRKGKKD